MYRIALIFYPSKFLLIAGYSKFWQYNNIYIEKNPLALLFTVSWVFISGRAPDAHQTTNVSKWFVKF